MLGKSSFSLDSRNDGGGGNEGGEILTLIGFETLFGFGIKP